MKREEVAEKYKWDSTLIFKNEKNFNTEIKKLDDLIKIVKSFEGKLNTVNKVLEYFNFETEVSKVFAKIGLYSEIKYFEDISDARSIKNNSLVESYEVKYNVASSFALPELGNLSVVFLKSLLKDKRFADYDRIIKSIIKNKPHIVSKEEEKLLSGIGDFAKFYDTFSFLTDAEMKFEPVLQLDETKKDLTNSSYRAFLQDGNENIRRQAHVNLHKKYSEYNLTLSNNYLSRVKYSDFSSKTRNFKSTFDRALFEEEIPKSVYETYLSAVKNHINLFYDFMEAKRRKLKQEKISIYDVYVSTEQKVEKKYNFEEGIELVKKAVLSLGEDYVELVQKAYDDRWIDVYPTENKMSGACSISTGIKLPYVMLNYENTFNDVSTLAHELGHSLHSYFAEQNQPFTKNHYVIYVAEVASTVNEMLLNRYMLATSTDKNFKNYIVENLLQEFYATVFRQSMFAEFEYDVHTKVGKGEVLTYENLNDIYQKLLETYFGKKVEIHDYAKYEWSRIPHFYNPFYVYKYATSFIASIAISEKLFDDKTGTYAKKYKKFLESGESTDPISLLKIADIDMTKPETYQYAFDFYEKLLSQYK